MVSLRKPTIASGGLRSKRSSSNTKPLKIVLSLFSQSDILASNMDCIGFLVFYMVIDNTEYFQGLFSPVGSCVKVVGNLASIFRHFIRYMRVKLQKKSVRNRHF